MVLKPFIAGTCAALFAGGLVYFNTPSVEPGGSVKIEATENAGQNGTSKDIVSRYIGPNAGADTVSVETTPPVHDDNPYEVETTDPEPETADSTYNSGNSFHPPESEVRPDEPKRKPRIFKETPRVETSTKRSRPHSNSAASNSPVSARIAAVFEQAENISQPDLRDRAYLDLTDYATDKGRFDEAERAALKIQQVELRDTARSRIAMGLARNGNSDEAFGLIEDVEVEELRDVMRLQVIEALLGTDNRR